MLAARVGQRYVDAGADLHDPANREGFSPPCLPCGARWAPYSVVDQLHELLDRVERHLGPDAADGWTETPVPGLALIASSRPTDPIPVVHEPMLCVVLAGAKRVVLGTRVIDYGAGDALTVSVDLPVSGQVIRSPYLALSFRLNPAAVTALLVDTQPLDTLVVAAAEAATAGLAVRPANAELLDALLRLVHLFDRPDDVAVLAPLVEREVLWRLLTGEQGTSLRQVGLPDSRASQVGRAIRHIRERYAETIRTEDLAQLAAMSLSSFHRHFRAVTSLSPLQYQKQIRLQEARARLLLHPGDVADVGFGVGYDSPSQFSREYARQFGAPPGRDAARLRQTPGPRSPI